MEMLLQGLISAFFTLTFIVLYLRALATYRAYRIKKILREADLTIDFEFGEDFIKTSPKKETKVH